MLSLFCSCFWTTTEEGKNPSRKFVHYIVYAPILGLIEIVTFPLAVFGYFFWILICNGKYLRSVHVLTEHFNHQISRQISRYFLWLEIGKDMEGPLVA